MKSESPTVRCACLSDKVRELGLHQPEALERLAISRGLTYYERPFSSPFSFSAGASLTDTELAVALLSPARQPSAREIRLAAALLGSLEVMADEVAELAVQENCTALVSYIARCGQRFEPENSFWTDLLKRLPESADVEDDWPHPTRFVEMTGMDRGKVGVSTRWLRPHQKLPV